MSNRPHLAAQARTYWWTSHIDAGADFARPPPSRISPPSRTETLQLLLFRPQIRAVPNACNVVSLIDVLVFSLLYVCSNDLAEKRVRHEDEDSLELGTWQTASSLLSSVCTGTARRVEDFDMLLCDQTWVRLITAGSRIPKMIPERSMYILRRNVPRSTTARRMVIRHTVRMTASNAIAVQWPVLPLPL
jgi:hypothetical protein